MSALFRCEVVQGMTAEAQGLVLQMQTLFELGNIQIPTISLEESHVRYLEEEQCLNLEAQYAHAISGFGHVRELVQNWYDQCKKLDDGVQVSAVTGSNCRLLMMVSATACVGCVLEWERPDGQQCMVLQNFGTFLHTNILALGHSEKGSEGAAGCYGEGMKVEINRLVVGNTFVQTLTGNTQWTFLHRARNAHRPQDSTLHVQFRPVQWSPHTSMLLAGSNLPALDVDKFLFLQPPRSPAFVGSNLEILLDDKFHGHVFTKGIHVMRCCELVGIGLNFIGQSQWYAYLGFGRDRNSLRIDLLIRTFLAWTVAELATQGVEVEPVIERLYSVLDKSPASAMKELLPLKQEQAVTRLEQLANPAQRVADLFVGCFRRRHGTKSFPVADDEKDAKQADVLTYLGAVAVKVSRELLKILQLSEACPSMESLWERAGLELLGRPDWTPQSAEDETVAKRFKGFVDAWFGGLVTGEQIVYKLFPEGNTTRVVVHITQRDPGGSGASTSLFAVDVSLLHTDRVHDWLRSQPVGGCFNKLANGSCGGACVVKRFKDALLAASESVSCDFKRKLEEQFELFHMKSLALHLPDMGGERDAVHPPHVDGTKQAAGIETNSDNGPAPTSHRAADTHDHASQQPGSSLSGYSEASPWRPWPDQSLEGAVSQAQSVVERCFARSGAQVSAIKESAKPALRFLKECHQEPTSEIDLVLADTINVCSLANSHYQCPLKLYVAATVAEGWRSGEQNQPRAMMEGLGSVLVTLAHAVFVWDEATTAATLSVVWEESERIAFNHGGLLFFNAAYYHAFLHHRAHGDAVHFWFVTFCHELAHNASRDHDKAHESAEEVLIITFLHRLLLLPPLR